MGSLWPRPARPVPTGGASAVSRRGLSAVLLVATTLTLLGAWSPEGYAAAPKPKAALDLCKPSEEIITLCHPKGLVFALCGMDRPGEQYVVYREQRGHGPITQFPEDPARYRDEFRFSNSGASSFHTRIRFVRGGVEHYVVDAMAKGGPVFDKHGWPVNATALIVKEPGRTRHYNCPWSDHPSIRHLGYELIPREAFDDEVY